MGIVVMETTSCIERGERRANGQRTNKANNHRMGLIMGSELYNSIHCITASEVIARLAVESARFTEWANMADDGQLVLDAIESMNDSDLTLYVTATPNGWMHTYITEWMLDNHISAINGGFKDVDEVRSFEITTSDKGWSFNLHRIR